MLLLSAGFKETGDEGAELEKQVFNKMRDTRKTRVFKTRPAFYPDAQRDRPEVRHNLGKNHEAVFHFLFFNIHEHGGIFTTTRSVRKAPKIFYVYNDEGRNVYRQKKA
jgi:hypothetical protein